MFVEMPRTATINSVNVRHLFIVSSRTIRSVQWSPMSLDALSKEWRPSELRLIVSCGNHISRPGTANCVQLSTMLCTIHSPALPPPHRSGLLLALPGTRLNRALAGTQESAPYPRPSLQSVCMPSIPKRPRRSGG